MTTKRIPVEERIWKYIPNRPDKGCWEWAGAISTSGYGNISSNRKPVYAHRVMWSMFFGSIPPEQQVLHSCDNRRCVNPSHLFLGSQSDNMIDSYKKERNSNAKVSYEDSESIRRLHSTGYSCESLAARFQVTSRTIRYIVYEGRRA